MHGLEMAIKQVWTVQVGTTVEDAASQMRDHHVGALVVVDADAITGIVTDRDIVVRAIAGGVPLDGRVDAIMTQDPLTIDAASDLDDALAIFDKHAFRRLPVTRDGKLTGMLTLDDLIPILAAELSEVARPILGEALFPAETQPSPLAST